MLVLMLVACGIDLPLRKGETVRFPLADVENGDGQSVAEFVDDELTVTLQVDWSFVNLPGLAPDVIDVTPLLVDSDGWCEVDDADLPTSCSFWAEVGVTSSSGWWEYSARDLVGWSPGELRYSFGDEVPLASDQAELIAAGVEDDGVTFTGDSLSVCIWRGADGSGQGLPRGAQREVAQVEGNDHVSQEVSLFAADDTVDGD